MRRVCRAIIFFFCNKRETIANIQLSFSLKTESFRHCGRRQNAPPFATFSFASLTFESFRLSKKKTFLQQSEVVATTLPCMTQKFSELPNPNSLPRVSVSAVTFDI